MYTSSFFLGNPVVIPPLSSVGLDNSLEYTQVQTDLAPINLTGNIFTNPSVPLNYSPLRISIFYQISTTGATPTTNVFEIPIRITVSASNYNLTPPSPYNLTLLVSDDLPARGVINISGDFILFPSPSTLQISVANQSGVRDIVAFVNPQFTPLVI